VNLLGFTKKRQESNLVGWNNIQVPPTHELYTGIASQASPYCTVEKDYDDAAIHLQILPTPLSNWKGRANKIKVIVSPYSRWGPGRLWHNHHQ
jgi:hypothetical protein